MTSKTQETPSQTPARANPAVMAIALAFGLFMLWQMLRRLPGTSGDASIYWTFARGMWEDGLFHFGGVGPKHGATSPLWAFLLSIVYVIKPHWYSGFQGLAICLIGLAAISTGLLARQVTRSTLAGLLAGNILLLSVPLHRYGVAGYDTGLIVLTMVEAVRGSLRLAEAPERVGRWVRWVIPMAMLPLARPEGVMFFPIIALWTGYAVGLKQGQLKNFLIFGFIAGLPALGFYLWMYAQTGHMVPTSVQGRDLVDNDSYWPDYPFYTIIYRNAGGLAAPDSAHAIAFIAGWMTMVALGGITLLRRRPVTALLLACPPAALCLMMLARNPSAYMVRYSLPVLTLGVTFGVMGLVTAAKFIERRAGKGAMLAGAAVAFALALAPIRVIHARADAPRKATPENVLDIEGTATLNEFLDEDDVAIVYEIQTTYYLKCKTIAASGIVGGEIFPYLTTKDEQKLKDAGVTHIFLSNAYDYRGIFDDTVLEHLWNVNDNVPIGGVVEYQGLKLKKLVARDFQIMKPHWIAVYELI